MKKYISISVFIISVVFTFSIVVSAQTDATTLILSNVRTENIVGSGTQIRWDTNIPANSQLSYGTSTANMNTFLDASARCDTTEQGYPYVIHHCITITNLSPGTVYYYKAQSTSSVNALGYIMNYFTSAGNAGAGLTPTPTPTPTSTTTPIPPSNLTATVSGNTVVLNWTDNSNNETGFKIYQGPIWTDIGNVEQNITTKIVTNLMPGSSYFKVQAYTVCCGSNYPVYSSASNIVGVVIGDALPTVTPTPSFTPTPTPTSTPIPTNINPANPAPDLVYAIPATPSGFSLNILNNNVNLTWIDNSNNESEFRLYKISTGGVWTLFKTLPPNTTSFIDLGVLPGNYAYDASACNSYGCSPFSNSAYATILAATISPTPRPEPTASPSPTAVPFPKLSDTKVISGTVLFSNGQPVTDAVVGVYSKDTGRWLSTHTSPDGHYSLNTSGGRWEIGVQPKDVLLAKWRFDQHTPFEFSINDTTETKTFNVTVPSYDSALTIVAVSDKGNVLSEAGISLSPYSSIQPYNSTIGTQGNIFGKTDLNGRTIFNLKPGTYYIRAFLPDTRGFINPAEQQVTITSGLNQEISIVFNSREVVANTLIRGITRLGDGTLTDAYVWAWSEKGRSFNTHASLNGEFSIQVSPDDKWHIGAGKMIDDTPHKSSEVIVAVGNISASVELILSKFGEPTVRPAMITQSSTQHITTQTSDGAKITIPANTIAVSGNVTVDVRPTIEAPSQPSSKVVSTVYDVTVKNASGQAIKEFSQDIEVVIPYNEAELAAQKLTEDSFVPSFFDEVTGTWVKVDNYTIDKDKNIVIMRVRHLTRFALVSAADVTPPLPPTSISAVALGQGKIKVTWVNPSQDFSHAKIYRSESLSTLGKIIASEVSGNEFTDDQDLKDQVTYYYVVRAVDPAGNETSNASPVSVKASGSSATLKDGDMISSAGSADPDIYIINGQGFKRLFLNPIIFGFYGHLGGFGQVKNVTSSVRDSYKTSGLFRNCETNLAGQADPKVYGVEITGEDTGTLHWVDTTGEKAVADDADFFKKVFCINNNEFNWYNKSSAYNSVNQIPSYSR